MTKNDKFMTKFSFFFCHEIFLMEKFLSFGKPITTGKNKEKPTVVGFSKICRQWDLKIHRISIRPYFIGFLNIS